MLKREVKKKVNRLSINNMTIHTYHSLAVKYYNESAYTDEEIKKILLVNLPIKNGFKKIDILLIDETQDMAQDYYQLIRKFISDTNSNPQIVIMGDRYQSIYEFKGANYKFLTLADKIWNFPFEKMTLSTSYRLTHQIAWFVNKVMLGIDRISTIKSGPTVDYYIGNSYEIYKKIAKQLRKLMKTDGIKDQDIFIDRKSVV
jgi:superfamily I DNA/RNA helicase